MMSDERLQSNPDRPMPSLPEQIELLRASGEQFTEEDKRASCLALANVMLAGGGGIEPALYDARVVPGIPRIIVPSGHVQQALDTIRLPHTTEKDASAFADSLFATDGLILGFSGYGSTGFGDYETEYDSIRGIFDECEAAGVLIGAVVTGGTGYGVPGLGLALARERGYDTVGYLPLRSLRGAAPSDTLVVVGEEFGDEAEALGSTPDVLVALGGGPIATEEVIAALHSGSQVILGRHKTYSTSSVVYADQTDALFQERLARGQVTISDSMDKMKEIFHELRLGLPGLKARRKRHAEALKDILAPVA